MAPRSGNHGGHEGYPVGSGDLPQWLLGKGPALLPGACDVVVTTQNRSLFTVTLPPKTLSGDERISTPTTVSDSDQLIFDNVAYSQLLSSPENRVGKPLSA